MRVRFIEGVVGVRIAYFPKDEADLPDAVARAYIAAGTCVPADQVMPGIRRRRRETALKPPYEQTRQ